MKILISFPQKSNFILKNLSYVVFLSSISFILCYSLGKCSLGIYEGIYGIGLCQVSPSLLPAGASSPPYVVAIDPGHGGKEPGAGSGTGIYERDVTYNIATYLKAYLESAGATVVFSRDNSASVPEIEERRFNTLKNNPDMFVSVHCDSSNDSSMNGSSVYYYKNYSGPLAFAISKNLPSAVKQDLNYAMFDKGAHFYPFMVTRVENCPSVLVECGFISNSQDFAIINSPAGQNSIARGIYNGIVEYCSWY